MNLQALVGMALQRGEFDYAKLLGDFILPEDRESLVPFVVDAFAFDVGLRQVSPGVAPH